MLQFQGFKKGMKGLIPKECHELLDIADTFIADSVDQAGSAIDKGANEVNNNIVKPTIATVTHNVPVIQQHAQNGIKQVENTFNKWKKRRG